ncbi:HNH endonuclease family protein (plasmid) [Streptomyces sp. AM 4-1-1]|uniref:HNH endonuclease family protein n=1 Tax=Streptomyces sp. AM 4-1-1 TaxID=3028710 RepID=UPI0023B8BE5A|nr:HNH endonuclease family protein [Streptomyces sp. AM 4-1-1]WEH37924.1 HNH endonuclease family protein [Streptomyces sp. AM 4-1-1]
MAPRLLAAGLVLAGALAASACGPLTPPGSSADAAPARGPAGDGTALAHLNNLTVQARTSLADYSRDAFGPAWSDAGTVEMSGNSCPTRQDVLARDLDDIVRAEDGCTVMSGVLRDRYTGRTIDFKRGPRTSMAVQIDHVVPLALGWQSGARELTAEQRLNYANDLENLVATDGPTNAGKGAKDAASWMPPRAEAHCWYATAQVRVKTKYRLSVTPSEKTALRTALESCPAEAARR